MRKRMIVTVAGLLAATAALTACGSSKSSKSESAATETSATASTEATETTAQAASGGASDDAYCAKVKEYKAKADATEPALKTSDPKQIQSAFESILDAVHDLDKDPPAAIAADVHTVRELADKLVSTFDKYGYDIAKLSAAPEFAELSKEMDGGAMTQANDRLDKWGQDVCGIAPDTTTVSGS